MQQRYLYNYCRTVITVVCNSDRHSSECNIAVVHNSGNSTVYLLVYVMLIW